MPGITSTLFTRDWLLEKNRSRVFPVSSVIRVGFSTRLVVIFQETARNHFLEAGMLMQSYMLETVQ